MWKEAEMPGENLCIRADDRIALSNTTTETVDRKDRIRLAAMRGECIIHYNSQTTITYTKMYERQGFDIKNSRLC